MDVEIERIQVSTRKLTIDSTTEPELFASSRSRFENMAHAELLANGLASPVSQAFGGSFTTFPIDNPSGE